MSLVANDWLRSREEVQNDIARLLDHAANARLPLSVRDAAAKTATAVVEGWFCCLTYDQWVGLCKETPMKPPIPTDRTLIDSGDVAACEVRPVERLEGHE